MKTRCTPCLIVGVMPASFRFPDPAIAFAFWEPLDVASPGRVRQAERASGPLPALDPALELSPSRGRSTGVGADSVGVNLVANML